MYIVATGDFRELPDFSGDYSKYFDPNSVDPGTLGTPISEVEFSVDENLTAFDTSPIIQRTDTPTKKAEPEPPEPATTVKLIKGANFKVYEDLKGVTFVPGSAGQMSQAIAYIRYWSRGNTNKKTPVQTEEQSSAPTDPQEKLKEDVDKTSTTETTNPAPQTTQPSTRTILTVPENRDGRRQPVPTQVPVTKPQPPPKSGKVVSANPSGPTSARKVIEAPDPTDAVWMFLFNPEELQLSSGPDYNRAETWGVSDPANSGQPLSWRANRNRRLSFGKVLLHGYTFGKRVDSLEAGIQQLFMAREGEGSDGPPVLEFVWGRRIFGPCVIQNIEVREKAWDKGILVNAEVSFELEQVPEWTINDGYVDILRPGRQPLVNDPLLPQGELKEGGDKKPPATKPGGGGGQKPESPVYNPTLCRFATEQIEIFGSFLTNNYGFNALLGNLKALISARQREDIFQKFYNIKKNFYSGSEEIGEYVDKKLTPRSKGCTRGGDPDNPIYRDTVEIILKEGGGSLIGPSSNQQAAGFVKSCVEETKKYIEEWQKTSPKCEAERKQAEEIAKCVKYRIGSECSSLASRATCPSVNDGKPVVCRRNSTGSGPRYVWRAE